jgi:hypothetical protein
MSRITGTSGPWSQPDVSFRQFKANATITAGQAVGLQTGATGDGVKIVAATAAIPPVGMACEGGASGDFIKVQTGGPNIVAAVTNGSVAAGNVVHSIAAGAMAGVTVAGFLATLTGAKVGYAIKDDSGNVGPVGSIFIDPFVKV